MVSKEDAKERIQKLIEKYKKIVDSGEIKQFNEARTKNELIEPLFEALGWDMRNTKTKDEVTMEETSSKGRVDYAFRIGNIPKFFLEAKKLSEDVEEMRYARQVINYAYHRGVIWAILTNFKTLKIFNAEWKTQNTYQSQFISLDFDQYIEKFDKLWWLSRDSIEKDILGKEAELVGKKAKKVSIDKQLLNDFMHWREELSKNILKNNKGLNLTREDIDESVQRLLDRFIFIRNCEDRGLEEKILISKAREWYDKEKGKLIDYLRNIFIYFDNNYDSELFQEHLCDDLEINNEVLWNIINGLYNTRDNLVMYDFSAIEADILGNIYEQYLANILKKTEKRTKVETKLAYKKQQGIYYTPTYIVEYIVNNTLGALLKEGKIKPEKIRILDLACGSGSFLIKAHDVLKKYLLEESKTGSLIDSILKTTRILENNIFGVDLDTKAVQITELNLLLKAAEKRQKLPLLRKNIKCGNSLIDDPTIAGDKAFKWEEEFKEIMGKGKFDVIIGNPPYVDIKQLDPKIVKYLFGKYSTVENRMNLYSTFVEKSLNLLKDGGYFGFIIPNSILYNRSYSKLRDLLLRNVSFKKIVRLPDNIFKHVKVETIILIYQKNGNKVKNEDCEILIYPREEIINSIDEESCKNIMHFNQNVWNLGKEKIINISMNVSSNKLLSKVEMKTKPLVELCDFSLGLTPYDKYKGHTKKQIEEKVFHSTEKKNATFKPLLSGSDIIRYGVFWSGKKYISYGNWLGAPREQRFFTAPRIVVRQIISGTPLRIYAGYTEDELYNTQIGFNIIVKNKSVIAKYILAILNSKLMNFYHKEKYLDPSKNLFQKILIVNAKRLPIKIIPIEKQKIVASLVSKMNLLNKKLNEIGNKNTLEKEKIESEIEIIDREIDEFIYKIYGIIETEKKIIEG